MDKQKNKIDFLDEVKSIVTKDRNLTYGEPEDNFKLIATLWSNYLNTPLTANDVGVLMALFKIARMKGDKTHTDNYIDAVGYLTCAYDTIIKFKGEKENE